MSRFISSTKYYAGGNIYNNFARPALSPAFTHTQPVGVIMSNDASESCYTVNYQAGESLAFTVFSTFTQVTVSLTESFSLTLTEVFPAF